MSLKHDIVVGLRSLRRTPFLSAAAALSLALGISVNSVVFSVMNALVLQPLPLREPERVMLLYQNRLQSPEDFGDVAPANFVDWRSQNRSFEHLGAYQSTQFVMLDQGGPEEMQGARVSAGFFETLGTPPLLGRSFAPDEARSQAAPVAIISHALWQRRFDGDRSVIGKQVRLDGVPHAIIGVMRPGWYLSSRSDIWAPLAWQGETLKRDDHYLTVVGRLRQGVTPEQAQADMSQVGRGLAATFPRENGGFGVLVKAIDKVFPGERDRRLTAILMGAVIMVLLIACANVANLQLAKGKGRAFEMATRSALGASRWALMRQSLVESVILALIGGAVALGLCSFAVEVLAATAWSGQYWNPLRLDGSVLAFTIGVSMLSGIAFGMAPALQVSAINLRPMLQESGRSGSQSRTYRHAARLLVAGEVMLALSLLVVGGDMIVGFLKLRNQQGGFDAEGLVTMRVSLPTAKFAKEQFTATQTVTPTFDRIRSKVAELPGVSGAAYTTQLPRSQSDPRVRFTLPEQRAAVGGEAPLASWRAVSLGYFELLAIPILQGRTFQSQDSITADLVAVVSQALARRYFPDGNVLGKQIFIFDAPRRIVGVVGDVLMDRSAVFGPAIYLPHPQSPRLAMTFMIKTSGDPASLLASLPSRVWQVDAEQPVSNVMTYETFSELQFAGRSLTTGMLMAFCLLALVMAAVGLYGLISYLVVQRTKDFGIRLTLGASRPRIFALVMREALLVSGMGVLAGVAVLVAARRVLAGFLGNVLNESWTLAVVVAVLLICVSVVASLIPAARATSIEPARAVRAA